MSDVFHTELVPCSLTLFVSRAQHSTLLVTLASGGLSEAQEISLLLIQTGGDWNPAIW